MGREIFIQYSKHLFMCYATCWAVWTKWYPARKEKAWDAQNMQFMTYFRQIIKCFITFYASFFRIEFQVLCLLLVGTIKFRYTTLHCYLIVSRSLIKFSRHFWLKCLPSLPALFRCCCFFVFKILWWIPILTYPAFVLDVVYDAEYKIIKWAWFAWMAVHDEYFQWTDNTFWFNVRKEEKKIIRQMKMYRKHRIAAGGWLAGWLVRWMHAVVKSEWILLYYN